MPSINTNLSASLVNSPNIAGLKDDQNSEMGRIKDLLTAQHALVNGEPLTNEQVELLLEAAGNDEAARQFILQAANRPAAGSEPDAIEWAAASATASTSNVLHEVDAAVASMSAPVQTD
jgi:hypothetical protein